MKTAKFYISIFMFICISIIAGCRDNLFKPESIVPDLISNSDSQMNFGEGSYKEKFILNPGETKIFNYDNTNLILIQSYSISNCTMNTRNTRDFLIRSSNQADSTSLPCNWKKSGSFAFEDLSIKNISAQQKIITVSLNGLLLNN